MFKSLGWTLLPALFMDSQAHCVIKAMMDVMVCVWICVCSQGIRHIYAQVSGGFFVVQEID